MRRFLIAAAVAAALFVPATLTPTETLASSCYVSGYSRADGTYVSGHYRSCPNDTPYDNWSTSGNTNPWTGEDGTHTPEPPIPFAPNRRSPSDWVIPHVSR